MSMIPVTGTARLIAKLLANRRTPQDEVAELIQTVHSAIADLATNAQCTDLDLSTGDEVEEHAPAAEVAHMIESAPARRRGRPRRAVPPEPSEPAPAPAPRLLRRAEVVSAAPATPFEIAPAHRGAVHGIVKWFDPHARRGALRVPGYGGDVTVDGRILAQSGITRLYKGQEVEADVVGSGDAPELVRLALPRGAAPMLTSAGIVRGRHAKPVVVELKREALRRVAARAEAEHLLSPRRSR